MNNPPTITIPTVHRIFPELLSHEIVGVQPMNAPNMLFAFTASNASIAIIVSNEKEKVQFSQLEITNRSIYVYVYKLDTFFLDFIKDVKLNEVADMRYNYILCTFKQDPNIDKLLSPLLKNQTIGIKYGCTFKRTSILKAMLMKV